MTCRKQKDQSLIPDTIKAKSKVFERALTNKRTQSLYFPNSEYEPAPYKFIFYPESGFKIAWDLLISLLIMYQVFAIPYYIAFSNAPSGYYLIDIATTTIFTVDIAISFNTAFYHKGDVVTNREGIAKKYLKFWFWVDLIATFPYSWIIDGKSAYTNHNDLTTNTGNIIFSGPSLLRIFKLTRVMSLLRITKFRKKMKELEYYMSSSQFSTLILAFKLLLLIVIVNHWIACFWIFLSYDNFETYQTWIFAKGLENESMMDVYISAMYFSITTMASVGYGDLVAISKAEKAYAIVSMLISSGFFTYIISNVGTLVAKQTSHFKQHRQRIMKFNSFIKEYEIPQNLKFKVRRYMDYVWEKRQVKMLQENDFLELLSEPLRDAIFYHTRCKFMKKCSILNKICVGQVSVQLARIFEHRVYAPSDVIFEEGEQNTEMHFILQGHVEVLHKNTRTVFKALSSGDYFGQISFFSQQPRKASTHCIEFVEILTLVRQKVDVLVERYPDVAMSLCSIKQRCEEGDLSELEIACYLCGVIGHAAVDCRRYVINANKEENDVKWLKARQVKTVLVNPFSLVDEPNYNRKSKRLKISRLLSTVGVTHSPARKLSPDIKSPQKKARGKPKGFRQNSESPDCSSRLDIILSEDESVLSDEEKSQSTVKANC